MQVTDTYDNKQESAARGAGGRGESKTMPDDDTEQESWGFARGADDPSSDLEAVTDEALERVRAISPQSRQLLELVLEGCGMADIAAKMSLSANEAEESRDVLLAELGVPSLTDAIRIGICAEYHQSKDRFVSPD